MKKRRLKDPCSLCPELVWQYDADGTAYCQAHARWRHVEIQRQQHPLDGLHDRPSAMPDRVQRATKTVVDTIKRIGYAEAFWVAEHLGFEWGVQWWNEQVVISLSDLQLVAFAAAMRAHREAVYPKRGVQDAKEAEQGKASRTRLRR